MDTGPAPPPYYMPTPPPLPPAAPAPAAPAAEASDAGDIETDKWSQQAL